jgi:hypothetical protein
LSCSMLAQCSLLIPVSNQYTDRAA